MITRRFRVLLISLVAMASLCTASTRAYACADNETEQCVLSLCGCAHDIDKPLPPITLPAPTLDDILNIVGSAVKGNVNALSQAIGKVVIGAACPGCNDLVLNKISKNDKAFVEFVVGRGFIILGVTGDPSLVVADAATSTAQYLKLRGGYNPLAPQPTIATRAPKFFEASDATCIVVDSKFKQGVVGWANPPKFKDKITGESAIWPQVLDLQKNDFIDVKAPLCPQQDDPDTGMQSIPFLRITYGYSNAVAGTPTQMKFFVFGRF